MTLSEIDQATNAIANAAKGEVNINRLRDQIASAGPIELLDSFYSFSAFGLESDARRDWLPTIKAALNLVQQAHRRGHPGT